MRAVGGLFLLDYSLLGCHLKDTDVDMAGFHVKAWMSWY